MSKSSAELTSYGNTGQLNASEAHKEPSAAIPTVEVQQHSPEELKTASVPESKELDLTPAMSSAHILPDTGIPVTSDDKESVDKAHEGVSYPGEDTAVNKKSPVLPTPVVSLAPLSTPLPIDSQTPTPMSESKSIAIGAETPSPADITGSENTGIKVSPVSTAAPEKDTSTKDEPMHVSPKQEVHLSLSRYLPHSYIERSALQKARIRSDSRNRHVQAAPTPPSFKTPRNFINKVLISAKEVSSGVHVIPATQNDKPVVIEKPTSPLSISHKSASRLG